MNSDRLEELLPLRCTLALQADLTAHKFGAKIQTRETSERLNAFACSQLLLHRCWDDGSTCQWW
jgi:hypothetical protein